MIFLQRNFIFEDKKRPLFSLNFVVKNEGRGFVRETEYRTGWTMVTGGLVVGLNHTVDFLQSTRRRIKKKDDIRMHGAVRHFKLA